MVTTTLLFDFMKNLQDDMALQHGRATTAVLVPPSPRQENHDRIILNTTEALSNRTLIRFAMQQQDGLTHSLRQQERYHQRRTQFRHWIEQQQQASQSLSSNSYFDDPLHLLYRSPRGGNGGGAQLVRGFTVTALILHILSYDPAFVAG